MLKLCSMHALVSFNLLVLLALFSGSKAADHFHNNINSVIREKEPIQVTKKYEPNWDSIDSRPLPDWYDFAKLGIFIHWGVFSVPSFSQSPAWGWYWWKSSHNPNWQNFMKENYRPDFTYPDFGSQFTAEFYNPDDWADLFKVAGAGYITLTSKHHEGYCNWPTNVSSWNWNSRDVGSHRDLVGDLAKSIRARTDLHFGLYHSLFEWFNPIFLRDQANNFTTTDFVSTKSMPELYEIVNAYKPDIVWSDGSGGTTSPYWNSTEFIAWLYNDSPVKDTVVINDRWGLDAMCKHGGFLTCSDRYSPGVLRKRKWENAMTLNKNSWGWRRDTNIEQFLTTQEMLQTFVKTISCGGNMLMNVGPTKAGVINPILQERLVEMGEWLSVNGEAVYGSRPWRAQNDSINPNVWYTCQPNPSVHLKAKEKTKSLRAFVQDRKNLTETKPKSSALREAEEKWKRYFETSRGAKPLKFVTDAVPIPFPIYAFVLEWPETNILILGEPANGTESSRVILLGEEGPWLDVQWTPIAPKGIAIEMPNIPISLLPHKLLWTFALFGFQ